MTAQYLSGLCLLLTLTLASMAQDEPVSVRVTGDRVNLRSLPSLKGDVVTQCARGEQLQAMSFEDEWVQVKVPERADLWVYGELVRDGVVVVGKLRVRAGPGISYGTVGVLGEGDRVAVRDDSGDWFKIAPPAGCSLWLSAQYVERGRSPAAPVVAVPPRAAGAVVVARPLSPDRAQDIAVASHPGVRPPASTPAPIPVPARVYGPPATTADPVGLVERLDPRPVVAGASGAASVASSPTGGAEPAVHASGVLSEYASIWTTPTRYRLVQRDECGRPLTTYYLSGHQPSLAQWKGRHVQVVGPTYWRQGLRHRVLNVRKIGDAAR